jgi:hypothetical protein
LAGFVHLGAQIGRYGPDIRVYQCGGWKADPPAATS